MSLIPLLVRETLQRRRVTLVLYHDPDPLTFERHLLVLRRLYTIIELRELAVALRDRTTGRLPRKALVVTLDDGHRGNLGLLPVLDRHGVPVTIFLCASIVGSDRHYWFKHAANATALKTMADGERLAHLRRSGFVESGERESLSDEEIRAMAGPRVDFQSHSLTHPILPRCDDEKARAEIAESKRDLSTRYGLDVYAFSYPNGDYSGRELRLVRESGYTCGVTVDLGFNSASTDPYRLKRICIDDNDGVDELVVKACGVWGAIRRAFGWRAEGDAAYR